MDQTEETPLLEYKDRLFAMFESALMSSNEYNGLRLSGLKGLELMVLSRNYLSANEVRQWDTVITLQPSHGFFLARYCCSVL